MKTPHWIVYDRCNGGYPVALDTAMDWHTARDYCYQRLLPGPWETIYCSSYETAQRIADFLNSEAKKDLP